MGYYNQQRFLSDFAIRTKENQKRIEYISDMSVGHEAELKDLYRFSRNDSAIQETAASISDIAKKNGLKCSPSSGLMKMMFSMHGTFVEDVRKAYRSLGWKPDYNYFDGTQLMNSFLGLVVLPYERFSKIRWNNLESMMRRDPNYYWLDNLVDNLYTEVIPDDDRCFIYSSYYEGKDLNADSRSRVVRFWRHLRNAFAHSGDGSLFFFPIVGSENMHDITHIGFYDCDERNGVVSRFLAKIAIDDVREIAASLDSIIQTMESQKQVDSPVSFEDAKNLIRNDPPARIATLLRDRMR